MDELEKATGEMILAYHELNGNVEEMSETPSPLMFMRFVAANRPFVIRGGCSDWPAMQKWDAFYLSHSMKNQMVKVATTPYGSV